MAFKLKASELPELLPWLEQHLPGTFMVQESLMTHLKGAYPDLDFIVDQWPNPQAVLVSVDPKGQKEYGCLFDGHFLGLFGLNTEAVASVLKAAYARFPVADWSEVKKFHCVTTSVITILKPLMVNDFDKQTAPVLLLKATSRDLKPVPVPDGMKLSPLTDATVGIVDSTWKFSNAHSGDYMRFLVRHHPSVAMTTASGEHVGHMVGRSARMIGFLYVMPRFRRQGHAKVIITQLAQKYFSAGEEDVYLGIEETNLSSVNLHLSLGFRPVTDSRFHWIRVPLKCGDWFQ